MSVGKLERGVTKARPSTARKLAEALGVVIPHLMGSTPAPKGEQQ